MRCAPTCGHSVRVLSCCLVAFGVNEQMRALTSAREARSRRRWTPKRAKSCELERSQDLDATEALRRRT